ncbi:DUF308 domain-containing protein [Brevundimonas sp.]|jgi:uncharacterized membrane protein HdeD (DUF308 family)|uniref:DUF308 domain-containing protein n=1 Tax=Brevundimonas sp. TaxID=1871086 RepID=UPI0017E5D7A9|nr:DUF308 domain-containing protein [Brevundimonas sp.]MBA4808795.1 DUF308 domain-containing protein [Brevundimonas sp.]
MAASLALDPHTSTVALRNYYYLRAGVAAAWVVAAFTAGVSNPVIGAVLLVLYPAWDALANLIDARGAGGYRANRSQVVNAAVSTLAALAMLGSLAVGINAAIGVFGLWAVLAGLLQLITGVRRWRTYGAQWAMILSGGQSVLAGGFFAFMATGPALLSIATVAGYAGFGAFYFLVSALWLTFRKPRNAA